MRQCTVSTPPRQGWAPVSAWSAEGPVSQGHKAQPGLVSSSDPWAQSDLTRRLTSQTDSFPVTSPLQQCSDPGWWAGVWSRAATQDRAQPVGGKLGILEQTPGCVQSGSTFCSSRGLLQAAPSSVLSTRLAVPSSHSVPKGSHPPHTLCQLPYPILTILKPETEARDLGGTLSCQGQAPFWGSIGVETPTYPGTLRPLPWHQQGPRWPLQNPAALYPVPRRHSMPPTLFSVENMEHPCPGCHSQHLNPSARSVWACSLRHMPPPCGTLAPMR